MVYLEIILLESWFIRRPALDSLLGVHLNKAPFLFGTPCLLYVNNYEFRLSSTPCLVPLLQVVSTAILLYPSEDLLWFYLPRLRRLKSTAWRYHLSNH